MADLANLKQTLGIAFKDDSLLRNALVHTSYINENPGFALTSNERLEFLGDAVLSLIIAEKLYQDFPDFDEGEMTKHRAALVRRETLARIARSIRLDENLFLGKGEEASGGRDKPTNLASAFEAVVAAVFLDQSFDITRDLILSLFDAELQKVASQQTTIDYKSELQEFIQAREPQTPTYRVIEATGPDHGKVFTIEVLLGERVLGRGTGKSKKAAESEAARVALEKLRTIFTA